MTLTEPSIQTDENPLMSRTDRRAVGRATAKEADARAQSAAAAASKEERLADLDVEDRSLDVADKRQKFERKLRQASREEKARVRKETVQRWKTRGKAVVQVLPVIVAVAAVAALITASVWIAWPAQAESMRADLGARSWIVPGVVEGLTWTFASLTIMAVWRNAPAGRYRAGTAVSALIAASLNLFHSPNLNAGEVNALASLAGVIAFESVVSLLQHTQSGRTAAQVREQIARWMAHPMVSATAWRIRAPYRKTISVPQAWDQAWQSHHGGEPGTTAGRVRRQRRAQARMERARNWTSRRRLKGLKRSAQAAAAEVEIAQRSQEAAAIRANEAEEKARQEAAEAEGRLSSQMYRELPWVAGPWMSLNRSGQGSQGAEIQFPPGESAPTTPAGNRPGNGEEPPARNAAQGSGNGAGSGAGNGSADEVERKFRPHLERAFQVARELAYEAATDKRRRTGNGFFSPYTLAERVGIRRKDGPALVGLLEAEPGFAEAMAEEIERARAATEKTTETEEEEATA